MEPFSLALGLESEEFKPWKGLLLAASDAILLVEGDLDKEYFEMLREEVHGQNRLTFDGEIVSYDGTGSLSNTVLLRFIKNRYNKLFVTYDLDAENTVAKSLKALGLERKNHFLPVGKNVAGKRSIEGLLPDSITTQCMVQTPRSYKQQLMVQRKSKQVLRTILRSYYSSNSRKRRCLVRTTTEPSISSSSPSTRRSVSGHSGKQEVNPAPGI